ncbi:alpha/beta fold hydrolase [Bifidobacterium aquikefiri]|uniref:Alpha/beta hydrolase n=1 Tax=Bifidobacterium aquikefiri TaxID=1653207 RepID=A0A261G988_9BIFI|nr:alpha/beta hydrolase [Bifidobacterium aquikefiri]OZG67793.1 alpha/beta hydrolase [Bifidobacterium aquikefiri]
MFVQKIGHGFPLLMLHGFPLDHRSLLPFEDFLPETGQWERYYIDLPGLGATRDDTKITCAQDILTRLTAYIDEEFRARRFAIVGYSFGGLLASALAAQYGSQITSMFLLAPETVPAQERRNLAKKVAYHMSDLPDSATQDELQAYKTTAVIYSAESFEAFRRYIYTGLVANAKNPAVEAVMNHPSLDRSPESYLSDYHEPVMIITGQHDSMVGYKDAFHLYESVHEGTFVCIPKAGHNIHVEHPDTVRALFQRWLDGIGEQ